MNLILFDEANIYQNFLPLTFTAPIAECRLGILTIREKWEKNLKLKASWLCDKSLQELFPVQTTADNLLINGALCPNTQLLEEIIKLKINEGIKSIDGRVLAIRLTDILDFSTAKYTVYQNEFLLLTHPHELFANNGTEIRRDFGLITKGRISGFILDEATKYYNIDNIFIEEGVKIRAAVLNAENGPIYIGKNAEIREGALIKGPFAMGEGAVLNMGAKMRGDITIGPYCKVGGEVSNTIFFSHSNKMHNGYLGNAVIGRFCNLGAGTTASNMKNTGSEVKVWNYTSEKAIPTGKKFCGLLMADHSKAGINSSFNTGSVVGVACNLYGSMMHSNFVPSFSWGENKNYDTFNFEKAIEMIERSYTSIDKKLSDEEKNLFAHIFNYDKKFHVNTHS